MKPLIVIMALIVSACCEEPTEAKHTWYDAAERVAWAQCSRWIECGTETQADWRLCVHDLVWDVCNRLLDQGMSCLAPYDRGFDEIVACAEWYEEVACTTYVEACWL